MDVDLVDHRGMSDVNLAKVASIQRSVQRAREELAAAGGEFAPDLTRQDAGVLDDLLQFSELVGRAG